MIIQFARQKKDNYSLSRIMFIIEAALEYFISIAVSFIYLAKITAEIGLSDATTGILSSFVSLGCSFQIIAIFIAHKNPVKRWVTTLHILSQILFAFIYIVPVFNLSKNLKIFAFIFLLLSANIIHNIIIPPKINWLMNLVDSDQKGRFTATKEMVSLLSGIVFSYALGSVMDFYTSKGMTNTAFIICGVGLFLIMIFHSITLILSKEKVIPELNKEKITLKSIKKLLTNNTLLKVTLISVLWNIANDTTISFLGSYQTKELQFTISFSSIIIMIGSLCRALISRPVGKLADKISFSKVLRNFLLIEAFAFAICMFTVPSNGKLLFSIFYILYCIGLAGVQGTTTFIIYDFISKKDITSALALKQTLAGLAGFISTLIMSQLVSFIQKCGNNFLGFFVYAQQVTAFFSLIIIISLIIYMKMVIEKLKKIDK